MTMAFRSSSTADTANSDTPAPPENYPHSGWTDNTRDPFYVPPELRGLYAKAQPPDNTVAGYFDAGSIRTISRGDDPRRTQVIEAGKPRQQPVVQKLSGWEGFPLWLHQFRLDEAARIHSRPKIERLPVPVCTVCARDLGMPPHSQWIIEAQQHLIACPGCAAAVADEVAARYRHARAGQPGPDGKTWAESVTATAAALLAAPDAQRATGDG
jgi:hypothetical protein